MTVLGHQVVMLCHKVVWAGAASQLFDVLTIQLDELATVTAAGAPLIRAAYRRLELARMPAPHSALLSVS